MAADRFASLSADELQALLEDRDSSNTKNVILAAKRILMEYCDVKNIVVEELLTKPKEEICCFLINFYAEIRKKDGNLYSRSSMISIRFGLQRYFQSQLKFDIINDSEFKLPNEMSKAVMVQLKKSGKANVQHKDAISKTDMQKLYSSDTLSTLTAQGLQYKVFMDIMYFTCRRGRENLRQMKKTDFVLKQDAQGRRFYQNKAQYETKNHREEDLGDDDNESARIYENTGT